jgi:hypothetical protein
LCVVCHRKNKSLSEPMFMEEPSMKTRLIKTLVLALLVLGSITIYADGTSPIPQCPPPGCFVQTAAQ